VWSYLPRLTSFGELPVAVIQVRSARFERGSVRYDTKKPDTAGAGDCYLIHVEQDPRTIAAQTQIADLQKQ